MNFEEAKKEYLFSVKHGKVQIKKYLGADSKVIIPGYIDNMPVTKIRAWAFFNNQAINEVVVPEMVKFIDYGAFCLCEALKKVKFSSKVFPPSIILNLNFCLLLIFPYFLLTISPKNLS